MDLSPSTADGLDRLNDAALEPLGRLKNLEELSLSGLKNIDRSFLAELPDLPNLKRLEIWDTDGPSDDALKHIAEMEHLEYLRLIRCWNISDEGLKHLHGHPNPTWLYLPRRDDTHAYTLDGLSKLMETLQVADSGTPNANRSGGTSNRSRR